VDVQVSSSQQQQTAMQFLQSQQQMIQQSNSNCTVRFPLTWESLTVSPIPTLTCRKLPSKAVVTQLSCVPDEYASWDPTVSTNGVGPVNLGLSLNLSV
jgi:predicted component of type VI protein secretion system